MKLFLFNLLINLLDLGSIGTLSEAIKTAEIGTDDLLHVLESSFIRRILF